MLLESVYVQNFRSINGAISAPLNANVVLVHGENGAGKTSLLSAIELALTGHVQSLHRADSDYDKQLLFRGAEVGKTAVTISDGKSSPSYSTRIGEDGFSDLVNMPADMAAFFSERAFLPQSLLSQLLQIYQDSSSSMNSPLASFVGELLGLDQLDAIESGLQSLKDVRNLRKRSGVFTELEEREALVKSRDERDRKLADSISSEADAALGELAERLRALEIYDVPNFSNYREIIERALSLPHESNLREAIGRQRELSAIVAQIKDSELYNQEELESALTRLDNVTSEYNQWNSQHRPKILDLEYSFYEVISEASLEADFLQSWHGARKISEAELQRHSDRLHGIRHDLSEIDKLTQELKEAQREVTAADEKIASIPDSAGSLASLLSEIGAFIVEDRCPVCERNFKECNEGPLTEKVHGKVKALSRSADQLIALSAERAKSERIKATCFERIGELRSRLPEQEEIASLEVKIEKINTFLQELTLSSHVLDEGKELRDSELGLRREISAYNSMQSVLSAARETLSQFAREIKYQSSDERVSLGTLGDALREELSKRERKYRVLTDTQSRVREIRTVIDRLREESDENQRLRNANKAELEVEQLRMQKAAEIRRQGGVLRASVDEVRSRIIRREFNERLNHLWRDLFVRLAPNEPFVPAFSVPTSETQRLEPKLVTNFRNGDSAGGTPGAMLSAGNLNTAALTLFLALHLAVPKNLPWLILDDPVQSMDDIHISNFASLLRTLAKEHGRQIVIAVHDRQLFDYLSLELSPAYPEDSLLTLEMSRARGGKSSCNVRRVEYKRDDAIGRVA
ncbi:AAA family ATPase [Psychromarinibacter halotolerans]|uniref:AAA family ATPase n=1 Tax=Psychromarinibacter halotolerans TaxID=1775175 RepID=A0ABV7GLD0_9RHOB|nr:AAA family ATPase [Psychromarinibacter halotolerans]MDF0597739.1 AAA family ATPase [Psychromarinibacter halotolerans]